MVDTLPDPETRCRRRDVAGRRCVVHPPLTLPSHCTGWRLEVDGRYLADGFESAEQALDWADPLIAGGAA